MGAKRALWHTDPRRGPWGRLGSVTRPGTRLGGPVLLPSTLPPRAAHTRWLPPRGPGPGPEAGSPPAPALSCSPRPRPPRLVPPVASPPRVAPPPADPRPRGPARALPDLRGSRRCWDTCHPESHPWPGRHTAASRGEQCLGGSVTSARVLVSQSDEPNTRLQSCWPLVLLTGEDTGVLLRASHPGLTCALSGSVCPFPLPLQE